MNRLLSPLLLLVLLLSACSTFENNAYKVIGSTAVTVDAARKGWNDYAMRGLATRQQVAEVADYYAKYQSAMLVAQRAVAGYKVSNNQDELSRALDGLSNASGDIIKVINVYMGKAVQ